MKKVHYFLKTTSNFYSILVKIGTLNGGNVLNLYTNLDVTMVVLYYSEVEDDLFVDGKLTRTVEYTRQPPKGLKEVLDAG